MAEPLPLRAFPRAITVLVVVSVVTNVILAVVIGVLAAFFIGRIHAAQIEACHQSNTARGRDVAIWNRLLLITPAQAKAESPAQRAEVVQLVHLVKVKDAPVDCAALYHG